MLLLIAVALIVIAVATVVYFITSTRSKVDQIAKDTENAKNDFINDVINDINHNDESLASYASALMKSVETVDKRVSAVEKQAAEISKTTADMSVKTNENVSGIIELKTVSAVMKKALDAVVEEGKILKGLLTQLDKKNTQLQLVVEGQKGDIKRLSSDITDIKVSTNSVKTDVSKLISQADQFAKDIRKGDTDLHGFITSVGSLTKDVENIKKEQTTLTTKLDALDKKLVDLQSKSSTDLSNLDKKLVDLQSKSSTDLSNLDKKLVDLQSKSLTDLTNLDKKFLDFQSKSSTDLTQLRKELTPTTFATATPAPTTTLATATPVSAPATTPTLAPTPAPAPAPTPTPAPVVPATVEMYETWTKTPKQKVIGGNENDREFQLCRIKYPNAILSGKTFDNPFGANKCFVAGLSKPDGTTVTWESNANDNTDFEYMDTNKKLAWTADPSATNKIVSGLYDTYRTNVCRGRIGEDWHPGYTYSRGNRSTQCYMNVGNKNVASQPHDTEFLITARTSSSDPLYMKIFRFEYTGKIQSFTLPKNAKTMKLELYGGAGGDNTYYGSKGGKGGKIIVDKIPVTGGQTLFVVVGGNGSLANWYTFASSGGGYTAVMSSAAADTAVWYASAGGGGGSGRKEGGLHGGVKTVTTATARAVGAGGINMSNTFNTRNVGLPGTTNGSATSGLSVNGPAGGNGGSFGYNGKTFGGGGAGVEYTDSFPGGGGGGGWIAGKGGDSDYTVGRGGQGGHNVYIPSGTLIESTPGVQSGNGLAIVSVYYE
jgi:predicted  nucleic acid-binding Zn-ribbon protein